MTKINEASNLGALGVPDELVGKIHKRHDLDHDTEFETLKTKGQMQAKLKDGRLIIGVSPEGQIASLGKDSGWSASKTVYLTIDGERESTRNLKDALALVPGRGWKWFASLNRSGSERKGEWYKGRDERESANEDIIYSVVSTLDKVYAGKIKADANEYADELRDMLITMIDAETGENMDRDAERRSNDDFGEARSAYRFLKTVANSDDPFLTIVKNDHFNWGVHRISQYLAGKVGYSNQDTDALGKWLRNEKLATQKIVQHFSTLLKNYRDSSLKAKGGAKIGKKVKPFAKVKKAWESYKKGGNIKPLS